MLKITVKDLEVLNLDSKLIDIYMDVDAFWVSDVLAPKELTITSAYRPGDRGVHGTMPVRGLDLRCHDAIMGNRIADYLNARWEYDFKRPEKVVAMYHNVGRGAHFHLQCHPNTSRRV